VVDSNSDFHAEAHGGEYFAGVECHQPSRYPGEECPFPGMCLPNSTCTSWRSGKFSAESTRSWQNPSTESDTLRTNLECPCGADCDGSFVNERWTPSDAACHTPWLSPHEMMSHIRGKTILFSGDSLVRQIFLRMVAHLRWFDTIVEHYFHKHARYFHNGVYDVLEIEEEPYSRNAAQVLEGEKLVEIIFNWAPEILPTTEALQEARPSILIVAINLWVLWEAFWDLNAAEYMTALIEQWNLSLTHVLWLTTADADEQDFTERNSAMRQWSAKNMQEGSDVNVYIVAVDKLADKSPFQRNSGGDSHYTCGFQAAFPGRLSVESVIKQPEDHDCRDMLNLNLVQLICGII